MIPAVEKEQFLAIYSLTYFIVGVRITKKLYHFSVTVCIVTVAFENNYFYPEEVGHDFS